MTGPLAQVYLVLPGLLPEGPDDKAEMHRELLTGPLTQSPSIRTAPDSSPVGSHSLRGPFSEEVNGPPWAPAPKKKPLHTDKQPLNFYFRVHFFPLQNSQSILTLA